MLKTAALTLLLAIGAAGRPALALDKVVVAAGRTSSVLPLFIADRRGFFKKYGIEVETKTIIDNSLVIASLVGDQVDVGASVLAVDGMNANIRKPDSMYWISMNAQNESHRMEQFVIRKGFAAKTLADLKGARIVSAPGLGNVSLAKAALAKAGLKDGDYRLDPMDPNQHVNVLTSKQYDAAYTLEPGATLMTSSGVASVLESGIIANVVLGDPKANAYVGGATITGTFLKKRPDVAKRFAQAWAEAVDLIDKNPEEARKYIVGNTPISESIADRVPLILFTMVDAASATDKNNMQAYLDFAAKIGALSERVDVAPYLKSF